MIDVLERTWRRSQVKARAGASGVGHRKVWAMCLHDGHDVSQATVWRLFRDECRILPASYRCERRLRAARREAVFAQEPTGVNQVWQLDFSESDILTGGTWLIAGCRDYWSKCEHPWHVSPTANSRDAIAAHPELRHVRT